MAVWRRVLVAVLAALAVWAGALSAPAGAHFADGSSISVRIGQTDVSATVRLSVGPLGEALTTTVAPREDFAAYAAEVIEYLDEHLTVLGGDGRPWAESYTNPRREAVEGAQAFTVDVAFDTGGSDPADFTLTYDAVIEAIGDHEVVVVVTDANGAVSNPGILDGGRTRLDIGEGAGSVAVVDMIEYGFDHVLDGADHLLFLVTLLLPAPLVVIGRQWRRSGSPGATVRKVVHVVTAFTIGHSVTLMISALGWVSAPVRPVETLIAVSVGVSAVHVIKPLARGGEVMIAAAFGLVHGLAFAGILADLGLSGSASVLSLLAFNVGIELAQLATVALIFPSLWLLSTNRWYPALRVTGALAALAAASAWALERLDVVANPLGPVEDAAIGHPWRVVATLAVIAIAAAAHQRRTQPDPLGVSR